LSVLVFDTSAYLNGRRDHYPPNSFPSVWDVIAVAMTECRIIAPREVYRELVAKDDEITEWCSSCPRMSSSTRSNRFSAGWVPCTRGFRIQDGGTERIRLSSLKPSTADSQS
jgi:hypothetical protein